MTLSIDIILVPQGAEYQAVCRGIKKLKSPPPQVIPIPLGINAVTDYFNQKPDLFLPNSQVILMGLAGSLSPHYQEGDVLIYNTCMLQSHHNQAPFSVVKTNQTLTNLLDAKLKPKVSLVNGLTTNQVISNSLEKQKLAKIYQTDVVDMEGYAVLSALENSCISLGIIRIISDNYNYNIPDLTPAITDTGKLKPLTLAWQFSKQPLAAFRLIKGSLIGLKILEKTVIKLLS
jgi:Phosphorylase superfamily